MAQRSSNLKKIFVFSTLVISQISFGQNDQLSKVTWKAPKSFAGVLYGTTYLPSDISCEVSVMRPQIGQPGVSHADNQISCVSASSSLMLKVNLGQQNSVAAWGNRFDKEPHFEVKGLLATELFSKLSKIYKTWICT